MVDVLKTVLRLVRSLWRVVTRRRGGVVRGYTVTVVDGGAIDMEKEIARYDAEIKRWNEYFEKLDSGDILPPAKGAE